MSVHKIEPRHGMRWEVRWRDPWDADVDHDVVRTQQFARKADAEAFQRKVEEVEAETDEFTFPDAGDLAHPRSAQAIVDALEELLSLLHPGCRGLHFSFTDNDPDGRQLPAAGAITWGHEGRPIPGLEWLAGRSGAEEAAA